MSVIQACPKCGGQGFYLKDYTLFTIAKWRNVSQAWAVLCRSCTDEHGVWSDQDAVKYIEAKKIVDRLNLYRLLGRKWPDHAALINGSSNSRDPWWKQEEAV